MRSKLEELHGRNSHMKKQIIQFIIRLVSYGVLIYFIYNETGIATTIFATLVYIESEANGLKNKIIFDWVKKLEDKNK